MNNLFIIFTLFLFIINSLICIYAINIAKYFRLIDYPTNNKKKIHLKPTPLVGGIIFFVNILFFVLYDVFFTSNIDLGGKFLTDLRFISLKQIAAFFVVSIFIYLVSFYDDVYDISPSRKTVLFSFALYFLIISNPNISISNLNFYNFEKNINFNNFAIFFTLFCFLAFMNAANMFDGINLQSAILYSSFLLIFYLKGIDQRFLLLFLMGLIFFIYNNMRGKIFLGNNGSYFLSFFVSAIIICDHNWNKNYFVEEIFLYMLIPGIDMIRLAILRILNNKSPMEGDSNHIHHLLLRRFNYKKSIIIIFLLIFSPIIIFNFFQFNPLVMIFLFFFVYLFILIECSKKLKK